MLYPDGIVRRHSGPLGAALRDRMVTRMDRETRFETIRRAYATQTMAAAGVVDRRIEAAFAAVKREDFLGPGPWQILRWDRGYEKAPSADPVYLYDDVVVAIVPERNLNNGQPSFLAALIAGSAPRPGGHAVHIGIGVGYYTAILARLVGRTGRVTAIEFDPTLAKRARTNLAGQRNIRVVHGDGTLILPLTAGRFPDADVQRGAVFRITRYGDEYAAERISAVAIFPCEGMRDDASEAALNAAFETGRVREVRRLYRRDDVPEADCWVPGPGWCL